MKGFYVPRYEREDFAGLEESDLVRRYDEGRERLAAIGGLVPDARDPVIEPGPLWLQVAFLENVIEYEKGS